MMGAGDIRRRTAPKFKLTDPSEFISWVVGRIEQIADSTSESNEKIASALIEVLPALDEQVTLLREIRDHLKWAHETSEQGGAEK